jgi:hypothetical protein
MVDLLTIISQRDPVVNVTLAESAKPAVEKAKDVLPIIEKAKEIKPIVEKTQQIDKKTDTNIVKQVISVPSHLDKSAIESEIDRAKRYIAFSYGDKASQDKTKLYLTELEKKLRSFNSYDVGTEYVQNDQIANIHKGEIIVDPKSSEILRKYGIKVEPIKVKNDDENINKNDRIENLLEKQVEIQTRMLNETKIISSNTRTEKKTPKKQVEPKKG